MILASNSPRRRELLSMMGISNFEVKPAEIEEKFDERLSPQEAVEKIALSKARYVAERENDLVLAADTLVFIDEKPLGKPENEEDAKNMLRVLSGKRHSVCTAVALIEKDREKVFSRTTYVNFREITEDEIEAYVRTGEPMDKAGAYAVQGIGGMFIDSIEGDFFTVVGLPVCALSCELKEFGYKLP